MDLMKFVPNEVSRKVGTALLATRMHSPTILFAAGVVGVVATAVLTAKATLKLEETLKETQALVDLGENLIDADDTDYSSEDFEKDLLKIRVRGAVNVAKLYTPAVVVGAVSIACLTGSHVVLTRRNVALTAAYAAVERGFNEYRRRVSDELGPEREQEFQNVIKTEKVVGEDGKKKTVKSVEASGGVYARVFDEHSRNWSKDPGHNQMFLRCQQNYANDLLNSRGHLFLNEVYDMLGLERSTAGAVVGWVLDNPDGGDDFVDFGIFNENLYMGQQFVNGSEKSVWLDFNVDGTIYKKIER